MESPQLSVVVPLFNEEESVRALVEQINGVLERLGRKYEIVLVDDGSTDKTLDILADLARNMPFLRVVSFRRNYGQTPAMTAGIEHARGEVIVTMDGDLQNDPRDIPTFLEHIEGGYDVVIGWRHNRQDRLITRRIPSIIANWLIGRVTGVPVKDNGCSLKAYRSAVIQRVPLYSEMHRFIPAMLSLSGARIIEIKVNHRARQFGVSKYGLSRIYKVLFDLITIKTLISSAARPLRWFAVLSAFSFLASTTALAYCLYYMLTDPQQSLIVMLGVSITFIASGVFLLLCGTLAELSYRAGTVKIHDLARTTACELS